MPIPSQPSAGDAAWLRSLPTLTGHAPEFVLEDVPDDPVTLFARWIAHAEANGVPEPHAMTLATVDVDGVPDARTLILKDAGPLGWAFAGHRRSAKGLQLAARPAAALNFWWQPLVRAVRVRGRVHEAAPAESAADLAARSAAARAGIAVGDWVLWRLVPDRVEFWQGAQDRDHRRLVFHRHGAGWTHALLRAEADDPEEDV